MYAGYNQYELKGVRIGNWVDEAALLEATGHNRGPRPGERRRTVLLTPSTRSRIGTAPSLQKKLSSSRFGGP